MNFVISIKLKKSTPSIIIMNKIYTQIVIPFAIIETIVWAAYFYSFPAFLPTWETSLGFSRTVLTGA